MIGLHHSIQWAHRGFPFLPLTGALIPEVGEKFFEIPAAARMTLSPVTEILVGRKPNP